MLYGQKMTRTMTRPALPIAAALAIASLACQSRPERQEVPSGDVDKYGRLLQDAAPDVRAEAANAVSRFGPRGAVFVPLLIAALHDAKSDRLGGLPRQVRQTQETRQVDEEAARSMATAIIRPCGVLGYLVGRGAWWPSEERLRLGRRAVGQVLGSSYHLLAPVWKLYPSLDPGVAPDALGLAGQSTCLQDTPEDLRALLLDLERAVGHAVPRLEEQLPASRDHIKSAVAEVDASIRAARQILNGVEVE
jgi:hypothetical protein